MISKEECRRAIGLWSDWNAKINVISRKDIDNLYEHHILHSLAIAEYLKRTGREPAAGETFLDVGCGGGFPGLPLAMEFPQAGFSLCDSIGKKIKVAEAVAEGTGLGNVKFFNCRAESIEGRFDWVVSRAVTSLDNFYPWVKGKFRKGILYLKGGDLQPEIEALGKKFGIPASNISVWPISEWLDDEFFLEKYVVEIKD